MISHIEGRVAEKRAGELVIDVNGVGFLLLCPASTIAAAPAAGETFRCYTHFSVYDGGMDLYGFYAEQVCFAFDSIMEGEQCLWQSLQMWITRAISIMKKNCQMQNLT